MSMRATHPPIHFSSLPPFPLSLLFLNNLQQQINSPTTSPKK